MASRIAAALAGLTILGGGLVFGASVIAAQGWFYPGYLSETGVPGSPHAAGYRAGIITLSVGLILLGLVLRRALPLVAGLLAMGGLLASAAGVVACTSGCPLPPYERTTLPDMVHATASVAALVACVAAMGVIAIGEPAAGLRSLCRAWLVVTVPLLVLVGSSLLFVGRGRLSGTSERVLLAVVMVWAVVVALLLALRPAGDRAAGPAGDRLAGPGRDRLAGSVSLGPLDAARTDYLAIFRRTR